MGEQSADNEVGYEESIRRLEREAKPLDPDAVERVLLRDEVVAYADRFLEAIDGRPAFVVSDGEDRIL
jgi:hypothetical protein